MECSPPRLRLIGESEEMLIALVPDLTELKVGTTPAGGEEELSLGFGVGLGSGSRSKVGVGARHKS